MKLYYQKGVKKTVFFSPLPQAMNGNSEACDTLIKYNHYKQLLLTAHDPAGDKELYLISGYGWTQSSLLAHISQRNPCSPYWNLGLSRQSLCFPVLYPRTETMPVHTQLFLLPISLYLITSFSGFILFYLIILQESLCHQILPDTSIHREQTFLQCSYKNDRKPNAQSLISQALLFNFVTIFSLL